MTAGSEFLTTREVAELLHAPEGTVRYWRYRRIGPPGIKIGKRVIYRRSDVDQWIAEREQGGPLLLPPPSAPVRGARISRIKAG